MSDDRIKEIKALIDVALAEMQNCQELERHTFRCGHTQTRKWVVAEGAERDLARELYKTIDCGFCRERATQAREDYYTPEMCEARRKESEANADRRNLAHEKVLLKAIHEVRNAIGRP